VDGCRLIINAAAPGAWNMAVDEALLLDAAENGSATLRFYAWSEPTLSLGYFQRVDDRQQHPPSRECAVVRRQTGGGAILHDCEITYSLVLPAIHPLARSTTDLYAAVHDVFISVLTPWSEQVGRHWTLLRLAQTARVASREEPFLCFERRAQNDVLLVGQVENRDRSRSESAAVPPAGAKILGSAQRRYRGALLQHGSLLLNRSAFAPELTGWRDLTGARVSAAGLVDSIAARLQNVLVGPQIRTELPGEAESNARRLTNRKYGAATWTNRR
jgi:lipoate-protein ligase A